VGPPRRHQDHDSGECARGPDGAGAVLCFEGTIEDVTERKRTGEALRQANHLLEAIVRASPLAMVVVDLSGSVRSWNPAAERMFGFAAAEVLAVSLPTFRRRSRGVPAPPGGRRGGNAARCRGNPFLPERQLDGGSRLVDRALRNSEGVVEGVVGMLADITERRRDERALHKANETLRR